jgi:hypothetical protein
MSHRPLLALNKKYRHYSPFMADFNALLFRGESDSLDFKRDQYPFAGAADHVKSELLKDILAMANSWRTETAYILIGVDDTKTPKEVTGITDHFDDASLQQFVNQKTHKPIVFSYQKTELKGKSIGVIEVPLQTRPFYLLKDYGKLKANTVYLRRGSATDEAAPDEICEIGISNIKLSGGDLHVSFASFEGRKTLGEKISIESLVFKVTDHKGVIPDYEPPLRGPFYIPSYSERPNVEYYRELVDGMHKMSLLQEAAITITNKGGQTAREIRLEFSIPDEKKVWEFALREDYPDEMPKKIHGMADRLIMPKIAKRPGAAGCEFEYIDGTWHLTFEFGDLQPSRTLWPSIAFYIGARESTILELQGKITADGLPLAAACYLTIQAKSSSYELTLGELIKQIEKE